MSYICLLANENGVVCASDSRETSTLTHRYKDKRQKTFAADAKNAVWCCCGSTRIGHLIYSSDCMRKTDRILKDDSIPFFDRLTLFEEMIKKETSPLWFARGSVHNFTLIFASAENGGAPMIGTITARDGVITDRRFFKPPVMIDAGKNARLLPPRTRYKPKPKDSLLTLSKRAQVRVREAVRYDAVRKRKEAAYIPTVGGKVQLERLRFLI